MKHLTPKQIKDLTGRLARRNRELKDEIHDILARSEEQHYKDLAGLVADAADEAVADALVDFDTTIVDRHVEEVRDIDAARQRLGDGTYGICIDCSAPVDYERLAAYPTAKRCIRCQQKREKTYSHQATPTL